MKRGILLVSGIMVFAGSLLLGTAMAGDTEIRSMAGVLSHLNHYPSDDEKKTLNGIVSSSASTANEKVLAQALINLEHKVADGDRAKVQKVAADGTAHEKTLAGIILNINHKPSDADKDALKKMMM